MDCTAFHSAYKHFLENSVLYRDLGAVRALIAKSPSRDRNNSILQAGYAVTGPSNTCFVRIVCSARLASKPDSLILCLMAMSRRA